MASCRPIPRDAPTIRATGFVEPILSDRVEHLYKSCQPQLLGTVSQLLKAFK